jgi:hypothetical protein
MSPAGPCCTSLSNQQLALQVVNRPFMESISAILGRTTIGACRTYTRNCAVIISLNRTPRTKNFIYEKPEKRVLLVKKIEEFKLSDNKGCCIFGIAGSGKSTLCNILQQELGEGKYAVCAPNHKTALLIGVVTLCNLFNIDAHTHTYLKSAVENIKFWYK